MFAMRFISRRKNARRPGWAGSAKTKPLTCHGAGLPDAFDQGSLKDPEQTSTTEVADPKPPVVLPVICHIDCGRLCTAPATALRVLPH
jgi:hypothetical protein